MYLFSQTVKIKIGFVLIVTGSCQANFSFKLLFSAYVEIIFINGGNILT